MRDSSAARTSRIIPLLVFASTSTAQTVSDESMTAASDPLPVLVTFTAVPRTAAERSSVLIVKTELSRNGLRILAHTHPEPSRTSLALVSVRSDAGLSRINELSVKIISAVPVASDLIVSPASMRKFGVASEL